MKLNFTKNARFIAIFMENAIAQTLRHILYLGSVTVRLKILFEVFI